MRLPFLVLIMAVCLVLAGCSKFEVYERNLVYLTDASLQEQRTAAMDRLEKAQLNLTQAQSSGDPARMKTAKAEYDEAFGRAKAVEMEERRRHRGW
jgi:hypothetical protein